MSLCPFAVAVDRNLMHAAEVADTQLGPALSFGRAYSEPVKKWSDAVIWQYASEFADQLHGLDVSLPSILPSAVLRHFKARVISALPMQHEAQPIGLHRDNDLLEDGAQNPLASFVGRGGMVP